MAFNLADILKEVSNSDTGREQIQYISLTQIDEDPQNFYQLSDIPALADNISLCGLQQPIRVRQKEDGRYVIVSGHRRRAALEMLVADGYEKWKEVPCIVEQDYVSPSLQQLRLIYANANTRKMTAAEISEQAEQVEVLLYRLKEEGYAFPGRMRDHVAEAVSVSKSKLARLKVIRENLDESWVDAWKAGDLTESQAYALAQMPKFWQSIIKENYGYSVKALYADVIGRFKDKFEKVNRIECAYGLQLCEHTVIMMGKICKETWGAPCTGCCFDCDKLQSCKNCCPEAAGKKKELKDVAKQANLAAKREKEERDRPGAEFARTVWQRIGIARKAAGVSVETIVKARGESFYNSTFDDSKQVRMESGEGQYGPESLVSFGYDVYARDLMKVVAVADALGCSLDYLLGRTDRMELVSNLDTGKEPEKVSDSGAVWQIGDPTKEGSYILLVRYDVGAPMVLEEWEWSSRHGWQDGSTLLDEGFVEIVGWIPKPDLPATVHSACNASCITGISPSGHCGAAAYCNSEYTCCLQCPEECNGRCGWIDDAAEVMAE